MISYLWRPICLYYISAIKFWGWKVIHAFETTKPSNRWNNSKFQIIWTTSSSPRKSTAQKNKIIHRNTLLDVGGIHILNSLESSCLSSLVPRSFAKTRCKILLPQCPGMVLTYACVNLYIYIYIYIQSNKHILCTIYIYIYMCMYICVCVYIYM